MSYKDIRKQSLKVKENPIVWNRRLKKRGGAENIESVPLDCYRCLYNFQPDWLVPEMRQGMVEEQEETLRTPPSVKFP